VLFAPAVPDHLYGEAVAAGGGVDVYAGGFHGGAGLVGMFAELQVALVTQVAGPRPESQGLVVAGEEDFPLEVGVSLVSANATLGTTYARHLRL